jgi:hypothetical protein
VRYNEIYNPKNDKMRTKRIFLMVLVVAGCLGFLNLSALQAGKDSSDANSNHAGIPNSGNTLYPNNGPESPHTSFPVQSTDPGPLFHGPSGVMFDSIPNPQHVPH